jgi:glycosyltransferase involved in cell wall biosynthesis
MEQVGNRPHWEHVVVFPGYVPSEDLPLLMNSCDAFIMPSAQELQSIATLEAMSCAKPSVGRQCPRAPRIGRARRQRPICSSRSMPASIAGIVQLFLEQAFSAGAEMGLAGLEKVQPHHLSNTISVMSSGMKASRRPH